ncbi:hypothetical protein [Rudaeicoccus suwonensis]|uniref:Uncharacterized protein n=1 Tax=Rudaeicoccus suwonensis TaxID=657409 RepID=A0A561E373_9MICO|nr:hypothetical protein [Rudaeicoccus suwonensis]TWE10066.1 hypothetical protein BKA23_2414 [Rudaeicoccus suwonensis]
MLGVAAGAQALVADLTSEADRRPAGSFRAGSAGVAATDSITADALLSRDSQVTRIDLDRLDTDHPHHLYLGGKVSGV